MRSAIQRFGSLVKFSHTVFALPFALSMFVIVSRVHPATVEQLLFILLCMVAARTSAMSYNRYLDSDIDAKNPRTAMRDIPAGKVTRNAALLLCIVSGGLFLFGAGLLGWHCFALAPVVLVILLFYSWTKRFTAWSHLVLGLSLGLAPGGVWYAMTGEVSWKPVAVMLSVLFWVAGFDLLYACQDVDFDRQSGLYSVPASLGIHRALVIARCMHFASAALLFLFGALMHLGLWYFLGAALFSALLISQHRLVRNDDLSRVNEAFFSRNGAASVLFFLFVLVDYYAR